jgi:hypothetical protein
MTKRDRGFAKDEIYSAAANTYSWRVWDKTTDEIWERGGYHNPEHALAAAEEFVDRWDWLGKGGYYAATGIPREEFSITILHKLEDDTKESWGEEEEVVKNIPYKRNHNRRSNKKYLQGLD